MDRKAIIRKYCEQLYASKFYNLNEMDIFLKRYKLTKLTIEETDKLNSPVSISEIEFIVKNLPTKDTSHSDGFTEKFRQTFKDKLTPIAHKHF